MSQESNVDKLVERFEVIHINHLPVACPTVELDARRVTEEVAKIPCQEEVGGLLWIAGIVRPDIFTRLEVSRLIRTTPALVIGALGCKSWPI